MESYEVLITIIGCVIIFVGVFYYNSKPELHNCGSCGKYLTYQADRYWYEMDGKKVPFCSKCNRKHDG